MYTYIYTKLDFNKWVYLAPSYCEWTFADERVFPVSRMCAAYRGNTYTKTHITKHMYSSG